MKKNHYGRAKDGYEWDDMLYNYASHIARTHRVPRSSFPEPMTQEQKDEVQLYHWAYNQKKLYKTGHMSPEHEYQFTLYGFDLENLGVSRLKETYEINVRKMMDVAQGFPDKDTDDKSLRSWMAQQGREWYRLSPQWKKDALDAVGAKVWMTNINIYKWLATLDQYKAALQNPYPEREARVWINQRIRALRKGAKYADWKRIVLAECGITAETPLLPDAYKQAWQRNLEEYKRLYPVGRKPSKFDKDGFKWQQWRIHEKYFIRKGRYNKDRIALLAEAGIVA